MALIELTLHSTVLSCQTSVWVSLPADAGKEQKARTLFLLHDQGQDCSTWMRNTSVERIASSHGIAVICPTCDRSMYSDMRYGPKYYQWISRELPAIMQWMFPVSTERRDMYAAGIGYGGYGALKLVLNHKERFSAACGICCFTDIVSRLKKESSSCDDAFLCFGPEAEAASAPENDIMSVASSLTKTRESIPEIFLFPGLNQIDDNQRMRSLLKEHVSIGLPRTQQQDIWDYADQTVRLFIQHLLTTVPEEES